MKSSEQKPVILCVDDEKIVLDTLSQQLTDAYGHEYEVELAESAEEAMEVLMELQSSNARCALLISDQLMPGMKGDSLLVFANRMYPAMSSLMLSGQASKEAIERAEVNGNLYKFVGKPWVKEELMDIVGEALHAWQAMRQQAVEAA